MAAGSTGDRELVHVEAAALDGGHRDQAGEAGHQPAVLLLGLGLGLVAALALALALGPGVPGEERGTAAALRPGLG